MRRSAPDADDLAKLLRSRGLRVTTQRILIAEAIAVLDHPTANDVYSYVSRKTPTIGLATVYRTISLFKRAGLVRELTNLKNSSRFEMRSEPHVNVVCVNCGRIWDMDPARSSRILRYLSRTGLNPVGCDVLVVCRSCGNGRRG